jgi:hypothetical protein
MDTSKIVYNFKRLAKIALLRACVKSFKPGWSFLSFHPKLMDSWKSSIFLGFSPLSAVLSG